MDKLYYLSVYIDVHNCAFKVVNIYIQIRHYIVTMGRKGLAGQEEWQVFALEIGDLVFRQRTLENGYDDEAGTGAKGVGAHKGPGQIADFMEDLYGLKVKRIKIELGWPYDFDKDVFLKKLEKAGIPKNYSETGRVLFILPDGKFHHVTHPLSRLSGKKGFGVADWDAHTDDYNYEDRKKDGGWGLKQNLACGKFTDLLTEDCGAGSLAYIGVCHEPHFKKSGWATQRDIERKGAKDATKELMDDVHEDEIYATVDFDVLNCKKENVRVCPEWKTVGSMGLAGLVDSIRTVREEKEIFAGDIVGYSSLEYLNNGRPDGREKLLTKKSCVAGAVVAGEIMGLDTSKAMEMMQETDREIKIYDSCKEGTKRFFGYIKKSLSGPW